MNKLQLPFAAPAKHTRKTPPKFAGVSVCVPAFSANKTTRDKAPKPPRLLTQSQLCERLSIHRSSLWRWIRAKRLPQLTLPGRTVRYSEDDVERLLREALASPLHKRGPKPKSTSVSTL